MNEAWHFQRTIAQPFEVQGRGLHSGKKARVKVLPGDVNRGIVFRVYSPSGETVIPASLRWLSPFPRSTSLMREGVELKTVEHFLAACYLMGVDNLEVLVWGDELPAEDTSSRIWIEKLGQAGIIVQNARSPFFEIRRFLQVGNGQSYILAFPARKMQVFYFLDAVEHSHFAQFVTFSEEDPFLELAASRTFAFHFELPYLKESGLGKGAQDWAIIFDAQGRPSLPLRFPGEPALHKVLDFLGDLFLLKVRVRGCFFAVRSGHSLNREMAKLLSEEMAANSEYSSYCLH
jgi:UDP-3-O-[3-hydroxymyristoyl] N-acetylglucosamine deacetylase